jgi:hypothetical protein
MNDTTIIQQLFGSAEPDNLPLHFRMMHSKPICQLPELRSESRFSRNELHPTQYYLNHLLYKPVSMADYDTLFQTALNHD